MTTTQEPAKTIWGHPFLDELETLRRDHLGDSLYRPPVEYKGIEEAADAKRKKHVGGTGNHKFVGEKYLRCPDKELRRLQLRKMVDEGGQVSVGVGLPSHPRLNRWNSNALGISEEEINRLEKQDPSPDGLLWEGWRTGAHRDDFWAVAVGCSLVGEGEKVVPEAQEKMQQEIENLRRQYVAWGVKDLDRALANAIEHAGVDIEHANISADAVKNYVKTDEEKAAMRRAYTLTLQMKGF